VDNLTDNQKLIILSILEAAFMHLDRDSFKKDVQMCMARNKAGEITNIKIADLVDIARAAAPKPTQPGKPNLRLV